MFIAKVTSKISFLLIKKNNDIPTKGIVRIIKHVVNDDGGTKQPSDFIITVTGNNVLPSTTVRSDDNGNTVTLNAGSFNVVAADEQGYSVTLIGDALGLLI